MLPQPADDLPGSLRVAHIDLFDEEAVCFWVMPSFHYLTHSNIQLREEWLVWVVRLSNGTFLATACLCFALRLRLGLGVCFRCSRNLSLRCLLLLYLNLLEQNGARRHLATRLQIQELIREG